MAQTTIGGRQILDGSVQRTDLDTTTVGQAVVAKIIQGTNVSLTSTGGDSGTGDVTISVPTLGVSTDAGNAAVLGSDSKIYVGDSGLAKVISQRTRGYNAIGNPNFEVDQRNVGASVNMAGGFAVDRWINGRVGTMVATTQQISATLPNVSIPGTNFRISGAYCRITLTTAQASLGTTDQLQIYQTVEGPNWRELSNDVHSVSVLVRSSVAGLSFGVTLRDSPATKSLTKLCTVPSANTWTLITLPNLPVWPAGNFPTLGVAAGTVGYLLDIVLAAGSTLTSPANDTWQTGNYLGAVGQSNFAASPVNSTFDIAFVQHEPGANCTSLIDKPFTGANGNLEECLRYYQKSWPYATAVGTANSVGVLQGYLPAGTPPLVPVRFPKIMAKTPTVTGYGNTTGAINNIRDATAGVDKAVTAAANQSDAGFNGFTIASPNAATWNYQFQYTADTGW